jgi:hypothetical protein
MRLSPDNRFKQIEAPVCPVRGSPRSKRHEPRHHSERSRSAIFFLTLAFRELGKPFYAVAIGADRFYRLSITLRSQAFASLRRPPRDPAGVCDRPLSIGPTQG